MASSTSRTFHRPPQTPTFPFTTLPPASILALTNNHKAKATTTSQPLSRPENFHSLRILQFPLPVAEKVTLRYAASWTFSIYAPQRGPGLILTHDSKTGGVAIYRFCGARMGWESIASFVLNRDVHYFRTDGETRVWLLGWRDKDKRQDLYCCFDIQVATKSLLEKFRRLLEMNQNLMVGMHCSGSERDVVDIFRGVPEMAADRGINDVRLIEEGVSYFKPASRKYRPEIADPDTDALEYEAETVETGDIFDGFTRCNEQPEKQKGTGERMFVDGYRLSTRQELRPAIPERMQPVFAEPTSAPNSPSKWTEPQSQTGLKRRRRPRRSLFCDEPPSPKGLEGIFPNGICVPMLPPYQPLEDLAWFPSLVNYNGP
ncbi:hypothetical protein K458DRAFT_390198 [Lentithecium fluviatile CBS 122367]|uniref:Uncharacterized protein n=1 Tax=Lentithecium fluviatile CBS 122367 TaxID=1168545 RepID=A0A6G1IXU3_9PLEO|nr:hypothetical protein K458DRAFT_390198 [Lentithecium fluviatile CBS 122367]